MYTFSSKLKTFSFILMVVGLLGIGYGFLTAPKTIQDVEQILAAESHGHGGGHGEAAGHEAKGHETEGHHEAAAAEGHESHEAAKPAQANDNHEAHADTAAHAAPAVAANVADKNLDSVHVDTISVVPATAVADSHNNNFEPSSFEP
ncbi:MAG: hypothetical protein QM717_02260 [Flavobacterium sp.]